MEKILTSDQLNRLQQFASSAVPKNGAQSPLNFTGRTTKREK